MIDWPMKPTVESREHYVVSPLASNEIESARYARSAFLMLLLLTQSPLLLAPLCPPFSFAKLSEIVVLTLRADAECKW